MTVSADPEARASKLEPPPLQKAGVVFTFDDAFVSQWLAAMPVFARHGARATFFVTSFDRLRPEQLTGLRTLRAAGHAIGCHGLRHRVAVKTVKESSLEKYLEVEIEPALKVMREAGFVPTSFAYPCSSHTAAIDQALAPHFRHLRTGTGPKAGHSLAQTNAIFTPLEKVKGRHCLVGVGIDYAGDQDWQARSLATIFGALDRASKRGEIVVFYAHNISEDGPGHHIRLNALDAILAHAATAGLAFYTYDDLP